MDINVKVCLLFDRGLTPYSTEKRDPTRMESTHSKKRNVHGQRENVALGTQRNLYSTDSRWGFALGIAHILGLVLGVTQILGFLDTNMLVYPT